MTNKNLTVGLLLVAIIAIGGLFYPQAKTFLGSPSGETNYNTLGVTGLKVGTNCGDSFSSSGCTKIDNYADGTCNAVTNTTLIGAASSSTFFVCTGATGVAAGDKIVVRLPMIFTNNTLYSLEAFGEYASTSNQFGFYIQNNTGAATSSFAQATTSIPWFAVR